MGGLTGALAPCVFLDTLYGTFNCLVCNAHASMRSSHPILNYTSAPLLKRCYLLHLKHFTLSRVYPLALWNHLPIFTVRSCYTMGLLTATANAAEKSADFSQSFHIDN